MIYLASQSPRRHELVQQLDISFQHLSVEINEISFSGEEPQSFAERMAREKAEAGVRNLSLLQKPIGLVLAADTIVVIDSHILGKPKDQDDFMRMLGLLSGNDHSVYSAVALNDGKVQKQVISVSRVTMRSLTESEMKRYWDSGEPRDKAGGYAVQGKAAQFITALNGSYSGVMGLPLFETAELLKQYHIQSNWLSPNE